MKSSRTCIPTPWEKKVHTKTKLFSIWLHLLLLNSLLILHFVQWKLSRLVSSICIQQCNQRRCLGPNPDFWLLFNLERLFPTNEGWRGKWNILQRFETTLVQTDSIHNDEIRLFRKDRCRSLWTCCTKTKRSMLKGNQFFSYFILRFGRTDIYRNLEWTIDGHFRRWLHCWCLLCYRLSSSWFSRFRHQQEPWQNCRRQWV